MISLYSFLLWFQVFYSTWQFLREAKFFRLPYLLILSIFKWRIKTFLPFKRKIYMFKPFIECNDSDETITIETEDVVSCKSDWYYNEGGVLYTDKRRVKLVEYLIGKLRTGEVIAKPNIDLLLPDLYLVNCCNTDDIFKYVNDYDVVTVEMRCFVGLSTGEELNKNFLRLASIWPLTLQARNYETASAILSGMLIILDVLSCPCNHFWKVFKEFSFKCVKLMISFIKDGDKRETIHTFLSTISCGFSYCDKINRMSYNKKVKYCIVSEYHHCKLKGKFKLRKVCNFNYREFKDFEKVSFNFSGMEIVVDPIGESDSGRWSFNMSINGVSYIEQDMTLKLFNNMVKLFSFCRDNENSIIVERIIGSCAHLPSPKQLFYQLRSFTVCVEFCEEQNVFISEENIFEDKRCISILSGSIEDPAMVSTLIEHNYRYFGNSLRFISLVRKLLLQRSCCWGMEGIGNSEFKKYLSDFSIIRESFGKRKISGCKIQNPSSCLSEMVKNGINKTVNYNSMEVKFRSKDPEVGPVKPSLIKRSLKEYSHLEEMARKRENPIFTTIKNTIDKKLEESGNEWIKAASKEYTKRTNLAEEKKMKRKEENLNSRITVWGEKCSYISFKERLSKSVNIKYNDISKDILNEFINHVSRSVKKNVDDTKLEVEHLKNLRIQRNEVQSEIDDINKSIIETDAKNGEEITEEVTLDMNYTKGKMKMLDDYIWGGKQDWSAFTDSPYAKKMEFKMNTILSFREVIVESKARRRENSKKEKGRKNETEVDVNEFLVKEEVKVRMGETEKGRKERNELSILQKKMSEKEKTLSSLGKEIRDIESMISIRFKKTRCMISEIENSIKKKTTNKSELERQGPLMEADMIKYVGKMYRKYSSSLLGEDGTFTEFKIKEMMRYDKIIDEINKKGWKIREVEKNKKVLIDSGDNPPKRGEEEGKMEFKEKVLRKIFEYKNSKGLVSRVVIENGMVREEEEDKMGFKGKGKGGEEEKKNPENKKIEKENRKREEKGKGKRNKGAMIGMIEEKYPALLDMTKNRIFIGKAKGRKKRKTEDGIKGYDHDRKMELMRFKLEILMGKIQNTEMISEVMEESKKILSSLENIV